MRKMGLFWFAAALLGAALIFGGCPTDADTETVTVTKGLAGDVKALQKLLEEGVTPIRYIGDLVLDGDTVVIPEGITVNVDGEVRLTGTNPVLGVVGGLTLGTGKYIEGTGVVVGGEAVFDLISAGASITQASIANALPTEEDAAATERSVTAVKDLELNTTAPAPDWYGYNLTVYVYGTLTVKGDATAPTPASVVAIGEVLIDAADGATVTTLVDADRVAVSNATITLEGGGKKVTVSLPTGSLSGPTFNVTGEGGVLKVSGPTDINATVKASNGFVEFVSGVTKADINGNGRVRFANSDGSTATGFTAASTITAGIIEFPNGFSTAANVTVSLDGDVYIGDGKKIILGASGTTGTLALGAGSTINVGTPGVETSVQLLSANSPLTAAGEGAELTAAADDPDPAKLVLDTADLALTGGVSFISDVEFAKGVTFSNTAFFAHGKTITLTAADGIITLGPGAALAVGAPSPSVPYPFYEVIGNHAESGTVTLTPVTSAVLTFDSEGTGITQSAFGSTATHGIKIGGAAELTAGVTYTVASADGAVGTLTIDTGATLTLFEGLLAEETGGPRPEAELVLTGAEDDNGATLAGAGSVIAGKTTITGAWQAVGDGTVTIAATGTATSRITASDATVVFTAGTGGTITQAAGDGNDLTIAANTTIDLKGSTSALLGKIVLISGTDPGKLSLTATSKILIGAGGSGSAATAISTITIGTKSVTSTGLAVADYQVVDASGTKYLLQIGGTTAGNITASATSSNDVPIASNSAFVGS